MKLSQMTTDQAANILLLVTPDIGAIMQDETLIEKFTNQTTEPGKATETGIKIFMDLLPILLTKYRKNIYNIIGALNEKTAEEVAEQSLKETIAEITEIFNDEDLLSFFTPSNISELTIPSDI